MDRHKVWKTPLQVIGMTALLSFSGLAAAEEQRCGELGSNCRCSESLDTSAWTVNGEFANPSNSTPGTKECSTSTYFPPAQLTAEPATGMPAGSTVDYVWRNNSSGNRLQMNGMTPLLPSTKRVCMRNYFRLASNYMPAGCQAAGKVIELSHSIAVGQQIVQIQAHDPNSTFNLWSDWKSGDGGLGSRNHTATKTGNLTIGDCLGEWCQVEYCESGDFAGGTGNFYAEAYVRRVRDNKRVDWAPDFLGTGKPNLTSIDFSRVLNGYRGPEYCTSTSLTSFNSWRETSHVMQAEWSSNQAGRFIGSAYEIEGGSSAQPPPPAAAPTVPPPPAVFALATTAVPSAGAVLLTSVISGGVGPYQFLFDCNVDQSWDGVVNTTQSTATYACPLNGRTVLDISAFGWDQATDASALVAVHFDATTFSGVLGKPGKPSLIAP